MESEIGEEIFEVYGNTDAPPSNILEKGRYKFALNDISNFISKNENKCAKVELLIEGRRLIVSLVLEGKMEWKWRQFLYAIGIRDKRQQFSISKSALLGKTGLADVIVKDRVLDDGSIIKQNDVRSFSPIENEVAPIKGVEPEDLEIQRLDLPERAAESIDEL